MADKFTKNLASSVPFTGSFPAGWNDPPPVRSNTSQTSGHMRLYLKRRIPFPVHGLTDQSALITPPKPTAVVQPNLPPMGNFPSPPTILSPNPIAIVHPMQENHVEMSDLPNNASSYVMEVLCEQTLHVRESTNVKRKEIKRRLSIIEQLWQSNNLSSNVQRKLYSIAQAIAKRNFSEAMDIYTNLALNNFNECGSWVVVLRHLVLTLKTEYQTASGDVAEPENNSTMYICDINQDKTKICMASSETAIALSNIVLPQSERVQNL